MGDLQVWLPHPNGVLTSEEAPSPSSLPCPSPSPSALPTTSNPNPSSISSESWCRAERTTHEIICRIQPTVVSEQRRKTVVDYVQRLIGGYLGSEVFPFGSVPLKTYLPDGDIDLTALSYQNVEDALAHDVRSVLEGEEQNKDAEFEVKDVQYIHAEVKLIKFLVQNIVVDISFNQLGGLCTLCFLEQVDRLIGKGHLFKRSIILIKAWCYYESRILGAHHGLISTYALETLVLYIFHLFHSSLDGPLAVLYRFLDYFSKFDWDYYGISLSGPVVVSSLPEIVVQMPETDGHDFFLKKDFLKNCVDMFSVPSRGVENNMRSFPPKHLNIVDPLKENNNLGRSVSKGNFYRIRSAFSYGARKLGRILLLPGESMEDELNKFFLNTLERHGSGQRPDVQDCYNHQDSSMLAVNESCVSLRPHLEKCAESTTFSGLLSVGSTGKVQKITNDCQEALSEKINSIDISGSEKEHGKEIHWERPSGNKLNGTSSSSITIFSSNELNGHEPQKCASSGHFSKKLGPNCSLEGDIVSGTRLAGDAKDLATSQSSSLSCKSPSSSNSHGAVSFARPFHTPHLYFFRPFQETEKLGNRDLEQMNSTIPENRPQALDEQQDHGKSACNDALQSCGEHMSPASVSLTDGFPVVCLDAYPSEISYHANDSLNFLELSSVTTSNVDFRERFMQCASGNNPVSSKSLSDLSGDYDSHFNSLRYGQSYHEYFLCGPVLPFPLQSPQYYNKSSWDALCRSAHLKQGMFSHVNANGVPGSGPVFPTASGYYPVNTPIVPGAFGVEEMPKPRGTGTYFPNTNHRPYRERPPGRGRNLASALHNQMPRPRNGRIVIQSDTMSLPEGLHELPQVHTVQQLQPFGVNGRAKPSPSDFTPASHTVARIIPHANGCVLPTESLEFGSFGPVLLVGDTSSEPGRQVDSSSLLHTSHCSGSTLPVAAIARSERIPQSYRLKDEDDFPPLSV